MIFPYPKPRVLKNSEDNIFLERLHWSHYIKFIV